jgi:hypothetical protein
MNKNTNNIGDNMINLAKVREFAGRFITYVVIAVVAFLVGMLVTIKGYEPASVPHGDANQVQLTEIMVAWVPETEQVYFIDRKTNKVTFALSKEVTTAVFSLKASAIQTDFTNVTDGGVAKRTTNTGGSKSKPSTTK